MRVTILLLLLQALLLLAVPCAAENVISVELLGGCPLNLRTPLHIHQRGAPDLEFTARYQSEPFETPYYYGVTISRWRRGEAWAVDFVHHKLIVANPPPEVQGFSVTHGFNILTLRRLWTLSGTVLSLGAGVVIAHPESRVRGRAFAENGGIGNKGYFVTGPVVTCGAGRRLGLSKSVFVSGEIRGTFARASVPINEGRATLTNAAIHLMAGVGVTL